MGVCAGVSVKNTQARSPFRRCAERTCADGSRSSRGKTRGPNGLVLIFNYLGIKYLAMTLGEFFEMCGEHPGLLLGFFMLVPLVALLAMFFSGGQGHLSPWKYLYSVLIYLVAIPGIFAVTLSVYMFLFERRSIMDTNIYTQVLPIFSMIITIALIKKQVDLDMVPGFGKISGLITILTVLIILMWIIDKTHIYSITFMPFYVVIIILVVGYLLIRAGMRKLAS